jgi:putative transposase
MRFERIAAEKASYPVSLMCQQMSVSRSGFYAWLRRTPSERQKRDAVLLHEIRSVHLEMKRAYGSPRICRELKRRGCRVGRHRVARLMRNAKLVGRKKVRRRFRVWDEPSISAADLVQRRFEVSGPNAVWVGDFTYLPASEGFYFLAVLMDLYSRRIVGWAVSDRLDTRLALETLHAALLTRSPKGGLIHHTDRGSQYGSQAYRAALLAHGIRPSMSRPGNCWDNAVVESFFATLKAEWDLDHPLVSLEEARARLFDYIESFYNQRRLHSRLGFTTPASFEMKSMERTQQLA